VETNISMAREKGQMSAAAGSTRDALKLSGLLSDKPPELDAVRITKVTVVLSDGKRESKQLQEPSPSKVVEGASRVLEPFEDPKVTLAIGAVTDGPNVQNLPPPRCPGD